MNNEKPCVLSIATSDSSGGAGIQADIKAISATGSYAATVIALLTAQNTTAVTDIFALPLNIISAQIDAVFSDLKVNAVKIGMLYSKDIMLHVKERLHHWQAKNIVLDPVMIAQTGAKLIDKQAIITLKNLFPIATLITPNIPEANFLLDQSINNIEEMIAAAEQLGKQYQTSVLLKGGHLTDSKCCDILFNAASGKIARFTDARINTQNTHGTGCTLSSAIASFLAQEKSLETAIADAKKYLTAAIDAGANWQLGHGDGPVDHFFNIGN